MCLKRTLGQCIWYEVSPQINFPGIEIQFGSADIPICQIELSRQDCKQLVSDIFLGLGNAMTENDILDSIHRF